MEDAGLETRECRWCGKELKQNVDEPNYNFSRRECCDRRCSGLLAAERRITNRKRKGKVVKGKWNPM